MEMESTVGESVRRQSARADGKYLSFSLGDEEYGIPVLGVREIVGVMPITRIPNLSPYVVGVINLRGKVVPVVDLRQKLGMAPIEYTRRTCIIVVRPTQNSMLGLLVDSVLEVMQPSAEEIDKTPGVCSQERGVTGVAKVRGKVKVLLDVGAVLREDLSGLRDLLGEG